VDSFTVDILWKVVELVNKKMHKEKVQIIINKTVEDFLSKDITDDKWLRNIDRERPENLKKENLERE
jgi:hypothetical protein